MQFDWTTFALEILNFLVLVWILQRFLYRPVKEAIGARKAAIQKTLAQAGAAQAEADALKRQYESRLADWSREKGASQARLQEEIDAERMRLLAGLKESLAQERERSRALDQRAKAEAARSAAERARAEGAQFAARLLSRMASPSLERKIVEAALEDLAALGESELQRLRAAGAETGYSMRVSSGFPIGEEDRDALGGALGRLLRNPVSCEFDEDPRLIAGLRIALGPWVLHANLRDELKWFAETPSHADRAS